MTIEERLWAKVDKTDGCWIWTGARYGRYGGIRVGGRAGKMVSVHRLTYEWANGPIPEGLEIDHLCRNRRCVRPSHLEAVTHAVNVQRSIGFSLNWGGRGGTRRAECQYGHGPLILRSGRRVCRQCRIDSTQRWRERSAT